MPMSYERREGIESIERREGIESIERREGIESIERREGIESISGVDLKGVTKCVYFPILTQMCYQNDSQENL